MISYNSLVIFVTAKGKRYLKRLEENKDWHSNCGILKASDVANANYGDVVLTTLGAPVRILEANLEDRLMGLKRQTQIIYPKDIAYICLHLGVGPGKIIGEAGCGSGGLTAAFSWFCGSSGIVISQDSREEFVRLAARNLEWAGVGQNVRLWHQDVKDGFKAQNADAVFLDMREPWLYLKQAHNALKPGGSAGFLLPTANQANELLLELEKENFDEIEMCEIFMRRWKPVADRLRPQDRMTAHTSFLIFAKKCTKSKIFNDHKPAGTRERKQNAARDARQEHFENALQDE